MLATPKLSSLEYRKCMRHFAAAVNLVCTDGKAGRRGLTVSAATSVSDDPPTVLVCLNRKSPENAWVKENGVFSINTLKHSDEKLARAFAGEGDLPHDERFGLGGWGTLATGAPVLLTSRVTLDCVVTDVQSIATHHVVFGEVVAATHSEDDEALVYFNRSYHSI